MRIVNDSNRSISWFVYNSDDDARFIALASGDLFDEGSHFDYTPPDNKTHAYWVNFTTRGNPAAILASASTVTKDQTVSLKGGGYRTEVS
jgi:hypothetical protein